MSAGRRLPYFRLYAADILDQLSGLPPAAWGLWLKLACRQWQDGSLPEDEEGLARAARLTVGQFKAAWRHVEREFPRLETGGRACPELAEQRVLAMGKTQQARDAALAKWAKCKPDNAAADADAVPAQSGRFAIKRERERRTKSEDQDHDQERGSDGARSPEGQAGLESSTGPAHEAPDWPALARALAPAGAVAPDLLARKLEGFLAGHPALRPPPDGAGFAGLLRAAARFVAEFQRLDPEEARSVRFPWAFVDAVGHLVTAEEGAGDGNSVRGGVTSRWFGDRVGERRAGLSAQSERTIRAAMEFAAERADPPGGDERPD